MVKRVREKLGMPVAILLDTKGPEYRIGTFENGKITLADGDKFVFTTEDCAGNGERVSVSYKKLPTELSVGDTILLNNGLLEFRVTATTETAELPPLRPVSRVSGCAVGTMMPRQGSLAIFSSRTRHPST